MHFHHTVLLLFALFVAAPLGAQHKKKIPYYDLDVIRGLFFQPNTIAPYTGMGFEEFADGRKKMQVPIKEGKINGMVKEWALNGQKIFEAQYEMGLQVALEEQWYVNGQKSLEIPYTAGKPSGMCIEWYKNGQKKSEGRFVNGKEEGEHLWWFFNGQLDQKLNYKNGKAEGLVTNWYESGQLKIEAEYHLGLKDGVMKRWYVNGQKHSEGRFKEGKEDGEEMTWGKSGLLEGKKVFEEGKLVQEYNYRSGSIFLGKSYLQVVNEKESFFAIEVKGGRVSPRWTNGLSSYSVDGNLLQLFNYPISNFVIAEAEGSTEAEMLTLFQKSEALILEEKYSTELDWKIDPQTNASGKDALYWSFAVPASFAQRKGAKKVMEEHFLSIICNKQILNLHSVVMEGENRETIREMMQGIANTLRVEKERIDLNTVLTDR